MISDDSAAACVRVSLWALAIEFCLLLTQRLASIFRYSSQEIALAQQIAELQKSKSDCSLNRDFVRLSRIDREIQDLEGKLSASKAAKPLWRRHVFAVPFVSRYLLMIGAFLYNIGNYIRLAGTIGEFAFDFQLPFYVVLIFMVFSLDSLKRRFGRIIHIKRKTA